MRKNPKYPRKVNLHFAKAYAVEMGLAVSTSEPHFFTGEDRKVVGLLTAELSLKQFSRRDALEIMGKVAELYSIATLDGNLLIEEFNVEVDRIGIPIAVVDASDDKLLNNLGEEHGPRIWRMITDVYDAVMKIIGKYEPVRERPIEIESRKREASGDTLSYVEVNAHFMGTPVEVIGLEDIGLGDITPTNPLDGRYVEAQIDFYDYSSDDLKLGRMMAQEFYTRAVDYFARELEVPKKVITDTQLVRVERARVYLPVARNTFNYRKFTLLNIDPLINELAPDPAEKRFKQLEHDDFKVPKLRTKKLQQQEVLDLVRGKYSRSAIAFAPHDSDYLCGEISREDLDEAEFDEFMQRLSSKTGEPKTQLKARLSYPNGVLIPLAQGNYDPLEDKKLYTLAPAELFEGLKTIPSPYDDDEPPPRKLIIDNPRRRRR